MAVEAQAVKWEPAIGECVSCGEEFEMPCKGWSYCPRCFHHPQNIEKEFNYVVQDMRERAHRDKEWLDKVIALPYEDRLDLASKRGHWVGYPEEVKGQEV
ncbi:MAG TPA: hypothetical protein VHA52_12605 [Candidatus Babeliaceae bacterium]|nr:hypothetical protein [Candidatus Babeliaceae bacterium]